MHDPSSQPTKPADIAATPVARRVAGANALDLREISGSGPGGRVTKDDVVKRLEGSAAAPAPARFGRANARTRCPGCGATFGGTSAQHQRP